MITTLALRQLKAQWRRPDGRALLLSIFLMTSLITLLSLTGDRLTKSLTIRSAEILGADMVISSHQPLASGWDQTTPFGLSTTKVTQFTSMVEAQDSMLLSSIRAVDAPYPLRGEIVTEPPHSMDAPSSGTVWVEPSVLSRLNINIGDSVNIGYSSFLVERTLISSPDRGSNFRSFNPHIIMSHDDLAATKVLAPGSRAHYRRLFSGTPEQITKAEQLFRANLKDKQQLYTAQGDQPTRGNAANNANQYLKLSALFALLLGSFSIYLSLRRFSADQRSRTALLMSLGLSRIQLFQLFSIQLFCGWLLAAIPGALLGFGLHNMVLWKLASLLPHPLPALSITSLISSPLLAGGILMIAGLATLLPLGKTSVLSLIRQGNDRPSTHKLLFWLTPITLFIIIAFFVESILFASLLTVSLLLSGLISGLCVQYLIHTLNQRLKSTVRLFPLLTLRIRQQRHWHRLQGGVLTLLLTLMTVLLFARQDMLSEWQGQLPADTPNQFVIDIQPWEKESVTQWLNDHNVSSTLYPIIRGRIESLNGQTIAQAFTNEQRQHNTLNRELNLTWGDKIPAHNTLEQGQWSSADNAISIEQSMADELSLVLGDTLGFRVGSDIFSGTVTSIRGVEWASFRPNFYVIFSPDVIDQLPATYITSFRTNAQQKNLTSQLLKAFPTLTLIDIEQLLLQAQDLINKLSDSASLILLLTLLSGLILVITTLQQDLVQRRFEVALLRTLGASANQARQLDMLEYLLMGLSCGVLTCIMSESLLFLIYTNLLKLEPQLHPLLWIALPTLATVLFSLTGLLTRKALSLPQSYQLLKSGD
ncbi:FtsX-like permease family protein [Neptunomonas sp.]|uniref:ABC transporter permease n=1 Tax=Neptunomonas sp. TaxID=1971898 RepID=UPI0025EF25E1|nr:FtsX-like permease family protein [Neptunomonas sp.]